VVTHNRTRGNYCQAPDSGNIETLPSLCDTGPEEAVARTVAHWRDPFTFAMTEPDVAHQMRQTFLLKSFATATTT